MSDQKYFKKIFESYNGRRYGRPWAAQVILRGVKLKYNFIDGSYAGDDNGGTIIVQLESNKFYAYGQSDNRGKNSFTSYIKTDEACETLPIDNIGLLRDELLKGV